jgi:class 3 adenylate cyclase
VGRHGDRQRPGRAHAILADAALSGSAESVAASPSRGSTTSSTSGSASMDVATVTKAAQAISGEVRLMELLSSLLSIVMENAGASRGVLLLPGSSELLVQAERRVGDATAELLQAVPLSRHDRLARSVIQYVARTRESVVLADAAASQFASDPYVAAAKPRSLLAAPLLHQGRLAGVVYLENDLATGAFTAERVELLAVLSGQIAVSINNAELYGRLEEKVAERTQQLEVRNRFIQQVFGRYLTEDVVESLLGTPQGLHMGGEKRVVTVMMSDLRGFTSLAEGLTPESVVLMLNNYLGAMTDVIVRHQGTIDEFLGDAILVVFGAPFLRDDDALRAVRCAVAMQVALSEVNAFNRSRGLPEVEMGIGIHTGEVVVGNIGSQKRAKYGVVGATVNLASRIESYTLGGDVLVSAQTLDAAGASVRVIDEMLVEPKGVREPITVHYVGGVEGGDALLLPRAAAPLEALAAPLDATVTVVRGKDATGGAVAARLVRASAFEGEFLCGAPIEPLANVRLRFPSLEGGLSRADAYAKILRRPVERGFAVRFTSLPHDLRGALSARPAT